MWFDSLVFAAALAGGVVAAVAGFGIGSMLTPALALQVDARLAVAAVSIPHALGTAFRFWLLGGRVDRRVLGSFGLGERRRWSRRRAAAVAYRDTGAHDRVRRLADLHGRGGADGVLAADAL